MTLLFLFGGHQLMTSQHQIKVNAKVDPISNEITVEQHIVYRNNTSTSIEIIYLNDWISSYSTSDTPLVKKFLNEFNTQLYVAKEKDRGRTKMVSVTNAEGNPIKFERLTTQQDFLKIILLIPFIFNVHFELFSTQIPSNINKFQISLQKINYM